MMMFTTNTAAAALQEFHTRPNHGPADARSDARSGNHSGAQADRAEVRWAPVRRTVALSTTVR